MTQEQAVEIIKILHSIDVANYIIMVYVGILVVIKIVKNWF